MKKKDIGPWTKTTKEILNLTSRLTLLMRDASSRSLEDARDRLQQFKDSWLVTGDGDLLPCSEINADIEGVLSDVDVVQFIIDAIDLKLDNQ